MARGPVTLSSCRHRLSVCQNYCQTSKISALLEHWKLLPEPLLYLSGYLKRYQTEYYRRLSVIRTEGDWEAWVSFFLEGVASAAPEAEQSIIAIASLVAADRRKLLRRPP